MHNDSLSPGNCLYLTCEQIERQNCFFIKIFMKLCNKQAGLTSSSFKVVLQFMKDFFLFILIKKWYDLALYPGWVKLYDLKREKTNIIYQLSW